MKILITSVAITLLIAITLAIVFQKFKSAELSHIQSAQQLLSQIKAQESYLDHDILKIHYGKLTHYDSLNHGQKNMFHLKHALSSLIQSQNIAFFNALTKALQLQGSTIEHFLSEQAVLANSLRYLPKAIATASQTYPQQQHHYTLLHLDLLIYLHHTGESLPLNSILKKYPLHTVPALQKHVQRIVQQHQRVRQIILDFHQASLYPTIEQFNRHLEQELKVNINAMQTYQWALLALTVLLILCIFSIIKILITKSTRLRAAVRRADGLQLAMDNHSIVTISDLYGRISYANDKFSVVTGYNKAELLGKNHRILNSNYHSEAFFKNMWDTIGQGKPWQGIVRNKKKNGQYYWVQSTITPLLDEHGMPYQYIAVRTDITQLIQAQQEKGKHQKKLEYAQRLESMGMLASGLAHDFNNILTAIMGNAGLIDRYLDAQHPAKNKLQRIVEASDKAAHLCAQMLAYSGKGSFTLQPYNISTLIQNMKGLLGTSIHKRTSITYQLMKNLPAAELDISQMQQVMLNMIINANEAIHHKNGSITIVTSVIHADDTYLEHTFATNKLLEADYILVEVSDNGCGMKKELLNKVFDPFFTTKIAGRGLGLSVLHGIILGHHGGIKIYSELGLGTAVKILLPICQQPSPKPQPIIEDKTTTLPNLSGIALVVDDDEVIREVASIILKDMGFEVIEAENGVEAIEIYRNYGHSVRFVLLDMAMPKMNGEEAFHELRKLNPKIQVIISSGYNEQEACQRFKGEGLAGFVQKPYLPDALQKKIIAALT